MLADLKLGHRQQRHQAPSERMKSKPQEATRDVVDSKASTQLGKLGSIHLSFAQIVVAARDVCDQLGAPIDTLSLSTITVEKRLPIRMIQHPVHAWISSSVPPFPILEDIAYHLGWLIASTCSDFVELAVIHLFRNVHRPANR